MFKFDMKYGNLMSIKFVNLPISYDLKHDSLVNLMLWKINPLKILYYTLKMRKKKRKKLSYLTTN